MTNFDIQTDAVDEDTLADYLAAPFDTCNAFAQWYLANVNENAVIKDSEFYGRDHCYVYDPELDATIDATCGQFQNRERAPDAWDDMPVAGAWDGDEHPFGHPKDEVFEHESYNDFVAQWQDVPNSPYIL